MILLVHLLVHLRVSRSVSSSACIRLILHDTEREYVCANTHRMGGGGGGGGVSHQLWCCRAFHG